MNLLKPAIAYFLCLFATGFALGTIRILWVVPRFGERTAELLEMPFILVAILIAARWINQHYCHAAASIQRLKIGFIALLFMLIADLGIGVFLRGMRPIEVITSRDVISGAAYYGMLLVFGLMPWILGRKD